MRLWEVIFDPAGARTRLDQLEAVMSEPGFWDDGGDQNLLRERSALNERCDVDRKIGEALDEAEAFLELAAEGEAEAAQEAEQALKLAKASLDSFELQLLLGDPDDARPALVDIHPGAGGTESQDWASMLLRMYLRWAESGGYKIEVIDETPGEEAGLKSATIRIEGPHAFGYLKGESGVHRLVRISPYDAASRRHTSFASVAVAPEVDADIEIDMEEKDLRIDTYRSSGAGGQHVNVTDSAVRITHVPTGLVAQSQAERSQHRNKAMAMTVLRARLYERERQIREAERAEKQGEKKEIGFGSQIRSYVLHPYQMAKDHRTDVERGNVSAVLDGDIQPFVEGYLKWQAGAE
ncbi:MAG: peptide chain release factor 2 [Acidobacteria bacterium]|nr:peptide chain release factor 2 [Acidobacteriota bacterium]